MWNLTTKQQWKTTFFVWIGSALIGLIILTLFELAPTNFQLTLATRYYIQFVFNRTTLFSIPAALTFFLLIKYLLPRIADIRLRNLMLYICACILACCTYVFFILLSFGKIDLLDITSGTSLISVCFIAVYGFSVSISILISITIRKSHG